ncbi:Protein phosphatase PTC7-like fig [Hondaea fermentalgiana]|uniref:Protein phosphatase n=1 Tax=Hondaea fermentalgiana TaxID=2315210 RepID=A0A2R5G8G2_9STRA|nr:Protein phosphatase PTC7-like fig [Hondaea fermentalgiana]|eukprot:GBG26068.1 Protein phosphatase PTC7-like fig [Hondaea fermentalgiana]
MAEISSPAQQAQRLFKQHEEDEHMDPAASCSPSRSPMQTPIGQRFGRRKMMHQVPARPLKKKKLRFFSAGAIIPHAKKHGEGEDAMFISQEGSAIGVSDGVGGWIEMGVDSGEYSRELMDNAKRFVQDSGSTDPVEILTASYDASQKKGTATACVMTIEDDVMRCVNLGDSGFIVLRPSAEGYFIVSVSKEQQHYFNCPKQLGTNSLDLPHDADRYEETLREGDLVIMGTDGLFDNLGVDDIIDILGMSDHEFSCEDADLRKFSHMLARGAYKVSQIPTYVSPFARAAQEHGIDHDGGKEDDITVIFAVVGRDPFDSEEPEHYLPPSAFPQVSKDGVSSSPASVYHDYESNSASPASTISFSSPSRMQTDDDDDDEETYNFGVASMMEE